MSELLTIKELEKQLKVSRQTLYQWRKQGMPYLKIGGGVRFEPAAVNEWIKKQSGAGINE